ncbi:MAG: NADH-quinone oxidoreductase subunit NuoE [Candidatus Aminicenantes bacterium]|jgi:NADH-quinone oxidoreductase E subunit|nr:NADH-quinone oxidoreductase subunit NuoE [Candidatus Aminicenantes bacterium]MCK4758956.1 NADH-quinone oxidoreductase subunit NuoE [Candidatus Aminicenantes bacterium]
MSPEFSEKVRKEIDRIVARYPQKEAAILPVLHITQQEFGFISPESEKLVAGILGIKPIQVREVVTFYTMLNREPIGKYHIQVCSNLSCSLLGAEKLTDYLKEKLSIEPGQTSKDKKFTLSLVECLGACEQAPCMMINFDYHGNLDKKKIDKILDGLE